MIDRYTRQTRFAPFGDAGHRRLAETSLAVVGLGGLGCTLAAAAVRSGAREVRLIDRDLVEESNLPRQMLFDAEDAQQGRPKAEAAARHLARIGSTTRSLPLARDLCVENVEELLEGVDLVLDGLDNFEGRYLLNDFCHQRGVPWVYGGAVGGAGSVLAIASGGEPCLRCLFPDVGGSGEPLPTCETQGVLSALPNLIASLQMCEAFRLLAEPDFESRLWHLDVWSGRAVASHATRSADCPCCSAGSYRALEAGTGELTTRLCGRQTVQVVPAGRRHLDLAAVAQGWQGLGEVQRSRFLARLHLPETVISVFSDGRALIQGVEDVERARSYYARYVSG